MPTLPSLIEVPARPMAAAPTLTVVVPCYNERPNVAPLVARLDAALYGIAWEAVFVDDNSPDGTASEVRRAAQTDPRIRCIRRIGRRGLASAVIEGALSSSAAFVAVIDGDLQHDETRLPDMLAALRTGKHDLAVGSRHVEGGDDAGLAGRWRHLLSDGGIRLAQAFLPVRLTDPMSGFFMLPRPLFEELAGKLTGQGFKILLDLTLSSPAPLRVIEIPCVFHARAAGESKLNALVLTQFVGLLLDKIFGGLLPLRFISFALVGALGVLVHLAVLTMSLKLLGLGFEAAQVAGTAVAMVFNFLLNNELTYRDQRLRGPHLWRGMLLFIVVCGLGAIANVGIAKTLYETHTSWSIAGAVGAAIGVVWNYAVSATLVWRAR
jgi:dolichol-phosphate mannosyltransferase